MEINSNNKNKEIILYKIDNNEDLYDESEKLLNKSKTEVEKGNFNLAKELFRKALNTNGDPACFFFGDVVRILIDKTVTHKFFQIIVIEVYTGCKFLWGIKMFHQTA